MELTSIGLICFLGTLAQVINLKVNYFKHTAVCLGYITGHGGFTSFPTYEYELVENGVSMTYKNRGTAWFYPRKGKKYKVLISKRNNNKVVGYSELVGYTVLSSLLFICTAVQIIFW